MDLTLDQYLAEVDRWKETAQSELAALTGDEQNARLIEARRQFEKVLESPLPELPATQPTN
ncbi:MAG: hypothetical protein WD894_15170 [Pirellulales bacterium]